MKRLSLVTCLLTLLTLVGPARRAEASGGGDVPTFDTLIDTHVLPDMDWSPIPPQGSPFRNEVNAGELLGVVIVNPPPDFAMNPDLYVVTYQGSYWQGGTQFFYFHTVNY